MSRSLPPHAHNDHLKKQAKDLLRAVRQGDHAAMARFRTHLSRLADSPQVDVSLQESQFIIAREYGFTNWADLIRQTGSIAPAPSTIRRVHDKMAPALGRHFSVALQRQVEVSLHLHETTMAEYVDSLGAACWNYCFRFGRREGGHLAFSLPLCAAILEPQAGLEQVQDKVDQILAYPADLEWVANDTFWATSRECVLLAQSVKAIALEMESAWEVPPGGGGTTEISDIALQIVPSLIYADDGSTPAVRATYAIEAGGLAGLTVDLCYVRSTIEPGLKWLESETRAD